MELNNLKGKVSTYLYLHDKEVIQKKKKKKKKKKKTLRPSSL